jgi:hypothetical protein
MQQIPSLQGSLIDVPKRLLRRTFLFDIYDRFRQRRELHRWTESGKPSPPPHAIKQLAIRTYAKRHHLRTLVETGTYLGQMVSAVRKDFDRIYTIELDETLHRSAAHKFRRYSHISVLQGDSGEVLGRVLRDIRQPSLFWLDGHYSGGVTGRGALQTPVLQELKSIFSHPVDGHVILIDDARCFNGTDDYPTLDFLRQVVADQPRRRSFEVADDIIRID